VNDRSSSSALDADAHDFAKVLQDRSRDPGLRKTERTRLRLLAGLARELTVEGRREGLKVAAVTADAGVAHGTFYRYFADIPAGMEALIDAFSAFVRDRLDGAGAPTPPERIRDIVKVQIGLFRDNAALMGCLQAPHEDIVTDAARARNWEWQMRMAAAIAKGRAASGEARQSPSDLLPTAYALSGMIEMFLARVYLRRDADLADLAEDEGELADILAGLWCRGAGVAVSAGEF
jgi:AcrR family transcriptional regulator